MFLGLMAVISGGGCLTDFGQRAVCGNGKLEAGEVCDGSDFGGQTCGSVLGSDFGDLKCTTSCTLDVSDCHGCGNAILDLGETCDDGSTLSHDGCSHRCQVELGWTCAGEPSFCEPICGDGLVVGWETCDDGNRDNGDGCDANCQLENIAVCEVDEVCDATAGEDPVHCPEDCSPGGPFDYVVSDMLIPTSSADAHIGVDLDGDGYIDNKLAQIMALLIAQGTADPNIAVDAAIDAGDLVVPLRLFADYFPTDAIVHLAVYQGVPLAEPPRFDGTDALSIQEDTPTDMHIGGNLGAGHLSCGPGQLWMPVPLFSHVVFMPLQRAQAVGGPVTAEGWADVMLGGGITEEDIEGRVFPGLFEYFNDLISSDPTSGAAKVLMDLFDGDCDPTVPGCAGVVPGEGECTVNERTDPPPVLTLTELRCNALLYFLTRPDVDSTGDGNKDLLSVGYGVKAVPAQIDF